MNSFKFRTGGKETLIDVLNVSSVVFLSGNEVIENFSAELKNTRDKRQILKLITAKDLECEFDGEWIPAKSISMSSNEDKYYINVEVVWETVEE